MMLPQHLEQLSASGISQDVICERGYWSATTKVELGLLGFSRAQLNTPALVIPIYDVHGELRLYQARPDTPRIKGGKPIKYETPAGAGLVLDVPRRVREQLGNPSVPLWVTEGAKKVDCAVSHGLTCIGVVGVYGWRGTNAEGGKTALPDLELIAWNSRKVYLAFDSDAMEKREVHEALRRLAELVSSRGAQVRYVYIPSADGRKVGLDDFLATGVTVEELLRTATSELHRLDGDESEAEPEWEPTSEAQAAGVALLEAPDVLERAAQTVAALGVAGDLTNVKLLYLAFTSRVFAQPINMAVIATSSAGKTHLVNSTAALFPERAVYHLDGASERALIYTQVDLSRRVIIISEADALPREGIGISALRALAWGGRLRYVTVATSRNGPPQAVEIDKPGPTGLITTSTRPVDDELDTRMLSISVDESNEATRAIVKANAARRNGHAPPTPDLEPWRAAQWWLAERGAHGVIIPYVEALASLVPDDQVRMRRDFEQLCNLLSALAILNQCRRQRDDEGRVIATFEDYATLHPIAAPIFGHIAAQGITPAVRRTVLAVGELIRDAVTTVTISQLARHLKLDRAPVSRQVNRALDAGWLINDEDRKGRPARLRPGDPLPEDRAALPTPAELQTAMDARAHPLSSTEGTQARADASADMDAGNGRATPEGTPKASEHAQACHPENTAHPRTSRDLSLAEAENGESVPPCSQEDTQGVVHTFRAAGITYTDDLRCKRHGDVWHWQCGDQWLCAACAPPRMGAAA